MEIQRVKTILASRLQCSPDAIDISHRAPLELQSNNLYDARVDGQHFIVKEFLRKEEQLAASKREYNALNLLRAYDVAPKPVLLDQSCGNPIVVYKFMEGEMWDRQRPTDSDLQDLLALWETINGVPSSDLWYSKGSERNIRETMWSVHRRLENYAIWTATNFEQGQHVSALFMTIANERSGVIDELMAKTPAYRFCKSDPRFANVIRRIDGRLGLIDWEDSGLRDPARELVDLIIHPNQEDLVAWHSWERFAQSYAASLHVEDKEVIDRMHLYLAIFPLFWLSILANKGMSLVEAGNIESWQVNGIPANLRMRRYLAKAIAWPDYDFSQQLEELADVEFFPEC